MRTPVALKRCSILASSFGVVRFAIIVGKGSDLGHTIVSQYRLRRSSCVVREFASVEPFATDTKSTPIPTVLEELGELLYSGVPGKLDYGRDLALNVEPKGSAGSMITGGGSAIGQLPRDIWPVPIKPALIRGRSTPRLRSTLRAKLATPPETATDSTRERASLPRHGVVWRTPIASRHSADDDSIAHEINQPWLRCNNAQPHCAFWTAQPNLEEVRQHWVEYPRLAIAAPTSSAEFVTRQEVTTPPE